jgi:ribosomal protein S18 acetylase RimI-like enzyme
MDEIVRQIEEAFVAHWSLLGQWPGARLVDEDGVLRFETPIPKIPYNGVIKTAIAAHADQVVPLVAEAFARRGSDFFWMLGPSSTPPDLGARLADAGLELVEQATGMVLELGTWNPPPLAEGPATIIEVVDEARLRDYEDIILFYWEVDESYRRNIERLNRYWFGPRAKGRRWVAYLDGAPVGKGYLSLAGPPGVAAIFGMSVRPEARGQGIAGALTTALINQAKQLGCRRVVLHSTDMAVGVYRRAGFVEHCTMDFYATAPIWSDDH